MWRCWSNSIQVLGGTEQAIVRICHATKNGAQFKTYVLFISGIFYFIFSDWVTETTESDVVANGAGAVEEGVGVAVILKFRVNS